MIRISQSTTLLWRVDNDLWLCGWKWSRYCSWNLKVDRQYFGTIHSRATYLTSNFESGAKIVVVPLFVLLLLSWSFLMSWTPIGCFPGLDPSGSRGIKILKIYDLTESLDNMGARICDPIGSLDKPGSPDLWSNRIPDPDPWDRIPGSIFGIHGHVWSSARTAFHFESSLTGRLNTSKQVGGPGPTPGGIPRLVVVVKIRHHLWPLVGIDQLTLAPLGGGKGPPLWFFANSSWSTRNFALKLAIPYRPTIPHLVSNK